MAFTVTNRGYVARLSSSTDSVSDTFTPAAGSLLICIIACQPGTISSISGHVTWTKVYNYTYTSGGTRSTEMWAGIVGGSPSSGAITVVHGYEEVSQLEFYEITGADTSGTTAAAFGVSASRDEYETSTSPATLTLSAFSSSSNMTFAWANILFAGAVTPAWSDGTFTTGTVRLDTYLLQSAWLFSEDTAVRVALTPTASKIRAIHAIEIKLASGGGGGEVSGTPLQNLGSGFGPARAARINGVLQ